MKSDVIKMSKLCLVQKELSMEGSLRFILHTLSS